jgi:hypothetical protein
MIRHWAGNLLWMAGSARAHRAYRRARRDPRRAQETILLDFLRRNAGSEYGRRHAYEKIRSISEFQDAVPVVSYEDLEPWVERIRNGEPNVLTVEPVVMMEKTSGSSRAAKYIPYTESLRREFQNAISAWMFDLFARRPGLLGGSQYWSISPVAREKETTPGGLAVGFEDDSEYLSSLERRLAGWVMAVPRSLCRIADVEESRRETLRHLIANRDLRFISVWNPSFLSILMSRLPRGLRPAELWPELKLISCWTSGPSRRFVPELRELFPGVEIQGKGLLATEGVVSFPEMGRPAPSAALTSHFLEFMDPDGRCRLVDELEVGSRYSVLMTTGGGFARYSLGDQVEVVAPSCLEFVGRTGDTSDLCGEKLSEVFVGPILEDASALFGLGGLLMLAPEWGRPPRYEFFVESGIAAPAATYVEKRLRQSVHYDYCRRLGQLDPVEGVSVTAGCERYVRGCERLGQRVGNVKPAYLRREFGWRDRLAGTHDS